VVSLSVHVTFDPTTPVKSRVMRETTIASPRVTPATFRISIPDSISAPTSCPRQKCPFTHSSTKAKIIRRGMRSHFRAVHLEDTIIIEEEGEFEQCIKCGFFGKNCNQEKHWNTKTCHDYTVRRESYFKNFAKVDAMKATFTVNGVRINRVKEFKYLGRILHE